MLALCASCEKIEIPRGAEAGNYNLVYMPAALNTVRETINYKDSTYVLIYGASYGGGEGYPEQQIQVDFQVSPDSVAVFNAANGTSYPLLPEACYELTASSSSIANGTVSTAPLALNINPSKGMELFKTYLLPVSIKSISSAAAKINTELATAYYLVTASLNLADFDDFDRTGWSIIGMSSEEESGEGPGNGRAIFVLDEDNTSFWHTRWSGGNAPAPHFLEFDMGQEKTIHGISTVGRTGSTSGRPEIIEVQFRNSEQEPWGEAIPVSLLNNNTVQRQFFDRSYQARQVRIVIAKNFNNLAFTHLSNFNLF